MWTLPGWAWAPAVALVALALPAGPGLVLAALSVLVTLVYGQAYAAQRELLKGELFTLSLFKKQQA